MKTLLWLASLAMIIVLITACGGGTPTAAPAAAAPTAAPAAAAPTAAPAAAAPTSCLPSKPAPEPPSTPRITISKEDLEKLAPELKRYQLSTEQINLGATVTFALPKIALGDRTALVLMVAPLSSPPTQTETDLEKCQATGFVIGVLQAIRELPLSNQQTLPAGMYLAIWNKEGIIWSDSNGKTYPPLKAQMRQMSRDVDPPEATITIQDICYSWLRIQVCTEPVPNSALSEAELKTIQGEMEAAKGRLVEAKVLTTEDAANVDARGTIPDVKGKNAVEQKQASLLAAPVTKAPQLPTTLADKPVLLGVFEVVLDTDLNGSVVAPGAYTVQVVSAGTNEWKARLTGANGSQQDVPAQMIEVRGQIAGQPEEPLGVLGMICIWRICIGK